MIWQVTQLLFPTIKTPRLPSHTHHFLEAITRRIFVAKLQPEAQIEVLNNLFHLVWSDLFNATITFLGVLLYHRLLRHHAH